MISNIPGLVSLYFSLIVLGVSFVILMIVLLVTIVLKIRKRKIPLRAIAGTSVFFILMLIQTVIISSEQFDSDSWFVYWIIGNLAIALFSTNLIRYYSV